MSHQSSALERVVALVYDKLISLYPRFFRVAYRDDLLTTFHALSLRHRDRGRLAQARFWVHALGDVAVSVARMWLRPPERQVRHPPTTSGRREGLLMDSLLQDIRFTLRTWVRSPGVIIGAVLTLALGIGGTTAIFSLANGIMFDTLSGSHPERLVFLLEAAADGSRNFLTYENFRDWQRESDTFEHMGVIADQSVAVSGDGRPERIRGMFVSASFFDVTQARFALGRPMRPAESMPGGDAVVVLSHGYWLQRFGGDPAIVGRHLTLNNVVHTIVGVLAADFQFPWDETSAWISLQTYPGNDFSRTNHSLFGVGRLQDGVALDAAKRDLDRIQAQIAATYPDLATWSETSVESLQEIIVDGDTRTLLLILLGSVGLVLLIVCANVANLQLVRTINREPEIAVRMALGGGRYRILRQLFAESLLLAAIGGGLGVLLAVLTHGAVTGIATLGGPVDVGFDIRVLGFAVAVTVAASLLFGLSPALHTARTDVMLAMRRAGVTAGPRRARVRNALVVGQIAIALILLIGAGLLTKSLVTLMRVDTGFDRDNLLTAEFRLPQNKYDTDESVVRLFEGLRERLHQLPGVQGAATVRSLPFSGNEGSFGLVVDGRDVAPEDAPPVRRNQVSPEYFDVMRIPLLQGRAFTAADRVGSPRVAIISRSVADRHFSGMDPVGQRIHRNGELVTIVGVVGDVRIALDGVSQETVYLPQAQEPYHFASIAVRTSINPGALMEPLRQALWELDADQPLWEIMTIDDRIVSRTRDERTGTFLLVAFALTALMLAAVGIGGVIAYAVGQRSREIGIRMALGAGKVRVTSMVVGQGARLLALGASAGLAGSLALSRLLESWLFGVERLDLVVYAAAPAALLVIGIAACWLPARRAARVDPAVAMRSE